MKRLQVGIYFNVLNSIQPPWKALSDFALHADLDNNGALNHTPAAFQHLVNQASHHHFSYFVLLSSIWANIKIAIFLLLLRALALVSTHSFHSVLVPSTFNIFFPLYYLFACRFGFFCLNFFFSAFCLDIYSFNIFFFFFKSAKLFLQIKKMAIVAVVVVVAIVRWFFECFRTASLALSTFRLRISACFIANRCTAMTWEWVWHRTVPRHLQLRNFRWSRVHIIIPIAQTLT